MITATGANDKYLRIYLNDHRAASKAGLALARRCQASNADTPLGNTLAQIVEEIAADAATLEAVARSFGVPPDPVKVAAARAGEVVGRLKPNGQIRGYSPLSRLLELEALLAGIDAKRSLWLSLKRTPMQPDPPVDYDTLVERAASQRQRLAPFHREAAELAFRGADAVAGTHAPG